MTRSLITGFETGSITAETGNVTGSAATIQSTIARTGTYALKLAVTSGVASYAVLTSSPPGFFRFYVRVTALPATTARVLVGHNTSLNIRLNPAGTLTVFNGATNIGTSTTALTDTARWYCVEMRDGTATGSPILRIDEVTEVSGTISGASFEMRFGAIDTVADTYTAYFDDVTVDSAAFPGAGVTALLLPISDNARATLWKGGGAGTTNLWDAVNNVPPAGLVSASATNTSQIEHAGTAAGSTDDYDANMQSYTTAGVPAGATVNGVQGIVVHGEDVGTGTKLLTFSVKSNPAQGAFETNFSAGGDSGSIGTYATNWRNALGTGLSGSGVTLGTSPVLSVRRPETASRVASVCFMGIYVDYTPAVALKPIPVRTTLQAVQRAAVR